MWEERESERRGAKRKSCFSYFVCAIAVMVFDFGGDLF